MTTSDQGNGDQEHPSTGSKHSSDQGQSIGPAGHPASGNQARRGQQPNYPASGNQTGRGRQSNYPASGNQTGRGQQSNHPASGDQTGYGRQSNYPASGNQTTGQQSNHPSGTGTKLDATALARIANEFMTALSGVSNEPGGFPQIQGAQSFGGSEGALPIDTLDIAHLASVPGTPFGGMPQIPSGQSSINAYPASLQQGSGVAQNAASPSIGAGRMPGAQTFPHQQQGMPAAGTTDLATAPSMRTPVGVPLNTGSAGISPGIADSASALLPNSPGMPGGFDAASISAVPSFSFIEEARSLFQYSETMVAAPMQPIDLLGTDRQMNAFAGGFQNDGLIKDMESLANVSAPQIPGAVAHPNVSYGSSVPGFTELIRPFGAADSMAPLGSSNSAISDFNLSSLFFDVDSIRRDFPILRQEINGHPLIWLDNAATTQKPQVVIDRLNYFYSFENSNIHRAAHELAARSTDAYEAARESTRRFLNAPSVSEIVFARGATEAINLVAQSWGRQNIREDDEIVITHLEHHANIVPWQMLCAEKGAKLRIAPVDDHGQILLDEYQRLLGPRTRFVSIAQVSNALGTVTPFQEMIEIAHRYGAKVLLDGAQAVSHMQVDVQEYDCDFYVFSGHKVFAPTGIGVLYGKSEVLNDMPPWQGGGNMIRDVTFERTLYHQAPGRFEAGTGSIADAVGLGAALDYLGRIGMINIERHEHELMEYGTELLKGIPGLHIIGNAAQKAGVLSFVLDGFTTEQVSQALNQEGIAVRAGHHCAQPILRRFGLESTVRPSLALYNTCDELDVLAASIWNLKQGRTAGLR